MPGRCQIVGAVNSSKFVVPEGYWEQYKRARVTFRHHIIYNPQTEVVDVLFVVAPIYRAFVALRGMFKFGSCRMHGVADAVWSGVLNTSRNVPRSR